jgi:hypothetical protein
LIHQSAKCAAKTAQMPVPHPHVWSGTHLLIFLNKIGFVLQKCVAAFNRSMIRRASAKGSMGSR